MAFLHTCRPAIVHGGLKTSNLLLEDDGQRVVISETGMAVRMPGQAGDLDLDAPTLAVTAPELLDNPYAPHTTATDVYAYGMTLLEIMSCQPAFGDMQEQDIRYMVLQGMRPTIPDNVSPDIADIINHCLAHDPAARPTFDRVKTMLELASARARGTSADPNAATATMMAHRGLPALPGHQLANVGGIIPEEYEGAVEGEEDEDDDGAAFHDAQQQQGGPALAPHLAGPGLGYRLSDVIEGEDEGAATPMVAAGTTLPAVIEGTHGGMEAVEEEVDTPVVAAGLPPVTEIAAYAQEEADEADTPVLGAGEQAAGYGYGYVGEADAETPVVAAGVPVESAFAGAALEGDVETPRVAAGAMMGEQGDEEVHGGMTLGEQGLVQQGGVYDHHQRVHEYDDDDDDDGLASHRMYSQPPLNP